jgi:N-carbamoylputrescine amidase
MDPARDSPGHSLEAAWAVLLAQRRGVPYPSSGWQRNFKVLRVEPVASVSCRCAASPISIETSAARRMRSRTQCGRALKSSACQNFSERPISVRARDPSRFDWAEPIPGPSTEALAKQAADLGVSLIASLFERRAAGLYHNTAVVLNGRGEIAGRYRKMHIPDDPLYYEKFHFTPGDLGFVAHQTEAGRLGVLVCWDQWFPEAARATALAGAEFLFYPTAIG